MLLGAALLICLVQAVSAASLLVAASDSSELSKEQADYICDGIQDQKEINAAFNELPLGGEVILSEGTFTSDAAIYPQKETTFRGQGDTKTFMEFTKNGRIQVDSEYVTLEKFHVSGTDHTSDMKWLGVITIKVGHCYVHDISGTADKTIQAVFKVLTDDASGYNKNIEDIEFINCNAIDCDGFGFIHDAWGEQYKLIKNVRYDNCQAINCGRYDQFNPWVTGFDFAELNDMDNLRVTGCYAEGCWESGFHFEWAPTTTDAVLTDCIAKNNGQKPFPDHDTQEFLAGYFIGKGDVTLIDCHAEGNSFAGYYADASNGMKMYNCTDKDTGIGRTDFSIYEPASFFMIHSSQPIVMENCSSTDSNGRGLFMGPTVADVDNFVMTNAAGVDGSAIKLGEASKNWYFKGSADIHASGNKAANLINVAGSKDAEFTGSIVSNVAEPVVFDGQGTSNVVIHDVETISTTLPANSTGIKLTDKISSGAVQIENCVVASETAA